MPDNRIGYGSDWDGGDGGDGGSGGSGYGGSGSGKFNPRMLEAIRNDRADVLSVASFLVVLSKVRPCQAARESFETRRRDGFNTWEFPSEDPEKDGLKFRRGINSLAHELSLSRDGETVLVILSILLHGMPSRRVADFVGVLLDNVPDEMPFKPSFDYSEKTVVALEAHLSCIAWDDELSRAEEAVREAPRKMNEEQVINYSRGDSRIVHDIPPKAMAGYYELLANVQRFRRPCFGELETSHSIVIPYLLAHTFAGLNVCVVIDDKVVQGSSVAGAYDVLLKRYSKEMRETKWRFVQEISDPQDFMRVEERGYERANRIPIAGIGRAITRNRGLEEAEANDLAALSVTLASDILSRLKKDICRKEPRTTFGKEVHEYSGADALIRDGSEPESMGKHIVPIETRLDKSAIALWWGCDMSYADLLFKRAGEVRKAQGSSQYDWKELTYTNPTMGKLARFNSLAKEDKLKLSNWARFPVTRDQYADLMQNLTTQLILIAFLGSASTSQSRIHVRYRRDPENTKVGKAIRNLENLKPLGVDDIMNSWYLWIKGIKPSKDWKRVDAYSGDGYLIYRNLMTDLSLKPDVCEAVLIEPGNIAFQKRRFDMIRGQLAGKIPCIVRGPPSYNLKIRQEQKRGPKEKRHRELKYPPLKASVNKTGTIVVKYHVAPDESKHDNYNLDIRLILREEPKITKKDQETRPRVSIETSIYELAQRCWTLRFARHDRENFKIRDEYERHFEDDLAPLNEREEVVELSPGQKPKDLQFLQGYGCTLYRAHGNDLGQVACLMSTESFEGFGLVKMGQCLRCCFSEAMEEGLSFVVD